jgi:hypothetical protein
MPKLAEPNSGFPKISDVQFTSLIYMTINFPVFARYVVNKIRGGGISMSIYYGQMILINL